ncbi:MAG: FixH family protein [Bdellovibrionales bacterium]|nr:FixH family protein [Bdellovibrionales bacterium]
MAQDNLQTDGLTAKISYYRWPIGIVLFFIALAIFNAFLAYLAYSGRRDRVVENPYEVGLKYEETIRSKALWNSLGLRLESSFGSPDESGLRTVNLVITPENRELDLPSSLLIEIERPSDARYDRSSRLTLMGDGVFQGSLDMPLDGLWKMTVRIKFAEQEAVFQEQVLLQD